MPTITTSSRTSIHIDPETVYDYVTDPRNWVGTHPVTADVRAAFTRSAAVGDHWVEVIQTGSGDRFDTTWTVTAAQPPTRWTIETAQLQFPGVRCRIEYTFSPAGDGTLFLREMTTTIDEGTPNAEVMAKRSADPTVHDKYLRRVAHALDARAGRVDGAPGRR